MSIASCTSTVLPSQTLFLQRLKSLRMGNRYHLHDSSIVTGRLSNLPATFPWPSSTHRDSCHMTLDGHSMSLSAGHAAKSLRRTSRIPISQDQPVPRVQICAPWTPVRRGKALFGRPNPRRGCRIVYPRWHITLNRYRRTALPLPTHVLLGKSVSINTFFQK